MLYCTAMKFSVTIKGDILAVPCGKGTDTIKILGELALKRYAKFNLQSAENKIVEIRRTNGGARLDQDDTIREVLDDNDFVTIVMANEMDSFYSYKTMDKLVWGKPGSTDRYLTLDGCSLSTGDVMDLGKGLYKIKIGEEALSKVDKARDLIDTIVREGKVCYGINTGFGKFSNVVIPHEELNELQENLIRSHAVGVGNPLTPDQMRRFMSLRINVLAKGYSGISNKVLQQFVAAFNANCLPWVPEKGTVGASGDLAPLAHMALGLMGEGKMWSPETGWDSSKHVLDVNHLSPIQLGPKEGLALINGTQMITAFGIEALERAIVVCDAANAISALSFEGLNGTTRAYDADIHRARPHKGQIKVAGYMRALLHSDTYRSEISEKNKPHERVQDAYTLRCIPQVHGIVYDTIDFVKDVLTVEINSGTDNPMVFAERADIISGGNFHGEYPAKVLDYLAIGIHELANMSERRLERLVNPAYSELPAFLCVNGGLNSGMMMAHVTAAALVSENKVLCHPSSVDSLSTSSGQEDHVSMGGWSARKAVRVVEHVEQVLAIELIAACLAIDFHRPLKTTEPLEEVYSLVRTVVGPWDKDRYMAPDIEAVTKLIQDGKIWSLVKPHIDHATEISPASEVIPASSSSSSSGTVAHGAQSNGHSHKRRRQH